MLLQKVVTCVCVLHTERDCFIEELTMEEVVGYETRLKVPMLSPPVVLLSKGYAKSIHCNTGLGIFSLLDGE